MRYCIFLLLIYMSIYAYVCVLFWWFCWKYFRLHDTEHNGLKISPLSKTEIQQRKKIYHNVSTCCAEAQNSHCGLQENNFRQCYISCFEALNYKLWEYPILLASAFPLAKRITELQQQNQYCFLSGTLKQTLTTLSKKWSWMNWKHPLLLGFPWIA